MDKILIVATTSYAGMGPYVSEIVNSLLPEDSVYFLFRDYDDDFFLKNIKKELYLKSEFIKIPNTRWNTILDMIRSKNSLQKDIFRICLEKGIKLVHFINRPADINTIKKLQKHEISVVSTIHDLRPHEARKEWYKMVRHFIMSKKYSNYIRNGHNFITNSKYQVQNMRFLYPGKNVYYQPFPSLVTETIRKGEEIPEELKGVNRQYILFFGRIEEYKGLALLYNVFITTPELYDNYDLVIAGKGANTNIRSGKNILFLNRYIKDEEIAYLYKNAKCVVYPYISATQSGVLSLAFYFETPILASDISFFKEIITDGYNGVLFNAGNETDLREKIHKLICMDTSEIIFNGKKFYKDNYMGDAQRASLLNIYNEILKQLNGNKRE